MQTTTIKSNLKSESFWVRSLFMVLFLIISSITKVLVTVVTVAQWAFVLLTSQPNDSLMKFGSSLSQYVGQVIKYLSYNTEQKPFPFSDWPDAQQADERLDNSEA